MISLKQDVDKGAREEDSAEKIEPVSAAGSRRCIMKLAIPVDEKDRELTISLAFGRTPYFLIYDTQTHEKLYIDNSTAAEGDCAGKASAKWIVQQDAKALLTPLCGLNALKALNDVGVTVYRSIPGSVEENIAAFQAGRLKKQEI